MDVFKNLDEEDYCEDLFRRSQLMKISEKDFLKIKKEFLEQEIKSLEEKINQQ